MKRLLISVFITCAGCTQYAQVQVNLTEQIRRGAQVSAEALQAQASIVERYHQSRRQELDRAFDEDVREREPLTADWVIEHRRAYAAAVEAMTRQQAEHAAWMETQRANFNSIDEACRQLMALQSLPLGLLKQETP